MDRRACNSLTEQLAQSQAAHAQCLKELQEERNQHGICQQTLQLEKESCQEAKQALYHACALSSHMDHILTKACDEEFNFKALEIEVQEQSATIEKLRGGISQTEEELAGSHDHYDALAEACNLKAMRVLELEERLSEAQAEIRVLEKELKEVIPYTP